MKTVLVAANTDLATDPRPNRMIRALTGNFRVVCAGYAHPNIPNVEFIKLSPRTIQRSPFRNRYRKYTRAGKLIFGNYESAFRANPTIASSSRTLANCKADLAWVHDLELLPLAIEAPNIKKVAIDAHEYFPSQHEDEIFWRLTEKRLQHYLVKKYFPMATLVTTVSEGLAAKFNQETNVSAQLVESMPDYAKLEPGKTGQKIGLVYHGKAHENRSIEDIIRLVDHLDERFTLNLILVGGRLEYRRMLQSMVDKRDRVSIQPPVEMRNIAAATNVYDIGLCAIPDSTFNLKHCLPNKLFEMIQARLALACWPSPDISRIVKTRKLGVVANSFSVESLAETINTLTARDVSQYKNNCHLSARELSFETTRQRIQSMTNTLLSDSSDAELRLPI